MSGRSDGWVIPVRATAVIMVLTLAILAAAVRQARTDDHGQEPRLRAITRDGRYKQRPAWSPDGTMLAFSRHENSGIFLFVLEIESGSERRLTDRKDAEYDAVWSPDGKRLAFSFVKTSPNQGDLEVYTIAADGTDLKPLAVTMNTLSHEESPGWSPEGRFVAFTSTRDGNQELYAAGADGSQPRRLTNHPAIDAHPAWSPDGKRIAFATGQWGDFELATVEPDGSNPTRLTHSRGLDDYPAWSPDGRRIAFTTNRDANFEIYLIDADGGNERNISRSSAIDHFPAWSPDGRLSFVSSRDRGFEIYVTEKPIP